MLILGAALRNYIEKIMFVSNSGLNYYRIIEYFLIKEVSVEYIYLKIHLILLYIIFLFKNIFLGPFYSFKSNT